MTDNTERDAAVAVALEQAAALAHPEDFDEGSSEWCALQATQRAIRALIPAGAQAALDKHDAELLEKASKAVRLISACMDTDKDAKLVRCIAQDILTIQATPDAPREGGK